MRRTLGVGAVVMLALLCAVPLAQAAYPGKNGKILFLRSESGAPCTAHVVNPDGTGLTDIGSPCGFLSEWSPDGSKYVVSHSQRFEIRDASGNLLASHAVPNLTSAPTWSPDATRLAYAYDAGEVCDFDGCFQDHGEIAVVKADGTGGESVIYTGNGGYGAPWPYNPEWSPGGAKLAFAGYLNAEGADVFTLTIDGASVVRLNSTLQSISSLDWSPRGDAIVVQGWTPSSEKLWIVPSSGGPATRLETGVPGDNHQPAWSPDGTKIAFSNTNSPEPAPDGQGIYVVGAGGGTATQVTHDPAEGAPIDFNADWQPIPVNAYPRPKAASPTDVSLVPAYSDCTAPNRVHGGALSHPSCASPAQTSTQATIGTADSNGAAASSVGHVKLKALSGDLGITVSITDVRNKTTLADYAGELRLQSVVRATDKLNTPHPGGSGPATVVDTGFGPSIPCAADGDPTIGSSCSLSTTVNALIPGLVVSGARSNWQLSQIRLFDGGTDGDGDTVGDNTVFAVQGVFVP